MPFVSEFVMVSKMSTHPSDRTIPPLSFRQRYERETGLRAKSKSAPILRLLACGVRVAGEVATTHEVCCLLEDRRSY